MYRRDILKFLSLVPVGGLLWSGSVKLLPVVPNFEETPDYFIGEHNRQAFKIASHFISSGCGENLLYIFGSCGNGKTELIKEVRQNFAKHNTSVAIYCKTAEGFLNDCIRALRKGDMKCFRDSIREPDLLIIEDSQYLARGECVQEELYHAIKYRLEQGKKTILTADKLVEDIKLLSPDTESLVSGGLLAEISKPALSEKYEFAKFEAKKRKVELPDQMLWQIAKKSTSLRATAGNIARVELRPLKNF